MRLTCLKCGHQTEVATGMHGVRISCVCGQDHTSPMVVNTGTRPNERAAERSRSRAFRAAGLVKNFGGFAVGISLLGILFFPIALLGAGIGIYVLTMLRGPLGRYSGRKAAMAAVIIGSVVFLGEGAVAMSWIKTRERQHMASVQASVSEDLRALLRAERLYRATHDTYGTFHEFRFRPPVGRYTVYLGVEDFVEARRDGEALRDPLAEGVFPAVSESAFTAIAVANLDRDPFLDVWQLTDDGAVVHVANDIGDARVEKIPSVPAVVGNDLGPGVETDEEAGTREAAEASPAAEVEKKAPAAVPVATREDNENGQKPVEASTEKPSAEKSAPPRVPPESVPVPVAPVADDSAKDAAAPEPVPDARPEVPNAKEKMPPDSALDVGTEASPDLPEPEAADTPSP